MITTLGSPKQLECENISALMGSSVNPIMDFAVSPCQKYLAAMSSYTLNIYSNSHLRVLLGKYIRVENTRNYGPHKALLWSPDCETILVSTYPGNHVLVYSLIDPEAEVSSSSTGEIGMNKQAFHDQNGGFALKVTLQQGPPLLLREYSTIKNLLVELRGVLNLVASSQSMTASDSYFIAGCARQTAFFLVGFTSFKMVGAVYLSEFLHYEEENVKDDEDDALFLSSQEIVSDFQQFKSRPLPFTHVNKPVRRVNKLRPLGETGALLYASTRSTSVIQHLRRLKRQRMETQLMNDDALPHNILSEIVNKFQNFKVALSGGEEEELPSLENPEPQNQTTLAKPSPFGSFPRQIGITERNEVAFSPSKTIVSALLSPIKIDNTEKSNQSLLTVLPESTALNQDLDTSDLLKIGIVSITLNMPLDLLACILSTGTTILLGWRDPFRLQVNSNTKSASPGTPFNSTHFMPSAASLLDKRNQKSGRLQEKTNEQQKHPIGIVLKEEGVLTLDMNSPQKLIVLGMTSGKIELIRVDPLRVETCITPYKVIDITQMWMLQCPLKNLGRIQCVQCSQDGLAIAVGWSKCDICVFSSMGQPILAPFYSSENNSRIPDKKLARLTFQGDAFISDQPKNNGGVFSMQWISYDLALIVCYRNAPTILSELPLYRSANLGVGISPLQGYGGRTSSDSMSRLFMGNSHFLLCGSAPWAPHTFRWTHIPLPPSLYMNENWPIRQACLSPKGDFLLAAGARGAALYSLRHRRWKLFSKVEEEYQLQVGSLPIGWYTERLFFLCVHKRPEGTPPAPLEGYDMERRLTSLPYQTVFETYKANKVEPLVYALLVFDVEHALSLENVVASMYSLPACPLRATVFTPSECLLPCASPVQEASPYTKLLFALSSETKTASASPSITPLLALYDSRVALTAYRLLFVRPPASFRASPRPPSPTLFQCVWMCSLASLGWVDHPLEIRFLGHPHALCVRHATHRLTFLSLYTADAEWPLSVPQCVAKESPPFLEAVYALWSNGPSQPAVFYPLGASILYDTAADTPLPALPLPAVPNDAVNPWHTPPPPPSTHTDLLFGFPSTQRERETGGALSSGVNGPRADGVASPTTAFPLTSHALLALSEEFPPSSGRQAATYVEEEASSTSLDSHFQQETQHAVIPPENHLVLPLLPVHTKEMDTLFPTVEGGTLAISPPSKSSETASASPPLPSQTTDVVEEEHGFKASTSTPPLPPTPPSTSIARRMEAYASLQAKECHFNAHLRDWIRTWPPSYTTAALDGGPCLQGGFYLWCQTPRGLEILTCAFYTAEPTHDDFHKFFFEKETFRLPPPSPAAALRFICRQSLLLPIQETAKPIRILAISAPMGVAMACSPTNVFAKNSLFPQVQLQVYAQPYVQRFLLSLLPFCYQVIKRKPDAWEATEAMAEKGNEVFEILIALCEALIVSPFFKHFLELMLHELLEEAVSAYNSIVKKLENEAKLTGGVTADPSMFPSRGREWLAFASTFVKAFLSMDASSPFVEAMALAEAATHMASTESASAVFSDEKAAKHVASTETISFFSGEKAPTHVFVLPEAAVSSFALQEACVRSKAFRALFYGCEVLHRFKTVLPEIFISGVRKTDPLIAPVVAFPVANINPHALFMDCLQNGQLKNASLYLTMLQTVVGPLYVRELYVLPLLQQCLQCHFMILTNNLLRFFRALYTHQTSVEDALDPNLPYFEDESESEDAEAGRFDVRQGKKTLVDLAMEQKQQFFMQEMPSEADSSPALLLESGSDTSLPQAGNFEETFADSNNFVLPEVPRAALDALEDVSSTATPEEPSLLKDVALGEVLRGLDHYLYEKADSSWWNEMFIPSSQLWRPCTYGPYLNIPSISFNESQGKDDVAHSIVLYKRMESMIATKLFELLATLQFLKLFHLASVLQIDLTAWLFPLRHLLKPKFTLPVVVKEANTEEEAEEEAEEEVVSPISETKEEKEAFSTNAFPIHNDATHGGSHQVEEVLTQSALLLEPITFVDILKRIDVQLLREKNVLHIGLSQTTPKDIQFEFFNILLQKHPKNFTDGDSASILIASIMRYFLRFFLILELPLPAFALAVSTGDVIITDMLLQTIPTMQRELCQLIEENGSAMEATFIARIKNVLHLE